MIGLTDKMGIFPAVNITNKKRNRNSPSSPRKYSSLYWRWCEFLRFGDFSKVSCEGAKPLRTIAKKHTGRERLRIWQTNSRTRNGTCQNVFQFHV